MHVNQNFGSEKERRRTEAKTCCKFFDECKGKAVVRLPQHNLNVCLKHFESYVNNQTIKTINKYHWYDFRKDAKLTKMLAESQQLQDANESLNATSAAILAEIQQMKERWAIAISGGRDSMALAKVLSEVLKDKVDLFGVHVDFGVSVNDGNKTETSSEFVKNFCKTIGMECKIIKAETLWNFSPLKAKGLITRSDTNEEPFHYFMQYLTFYALEKTNLNCDRICIARNMTEESIESLTRFVEMDITRLGAIRPWEKKVGNATLVLPFIELTQEEITLFCSSKGIQYIQTLFDEPTPFKLSIKSHIEQLERANPGKTLKIIRSYYKHISPLLALGLPNTPQNDFDSEEKEEIAHAVALPLPIWRETPSQNICEKCGFCCEPVFSLADDKCIGCSLERRKDDTPTILDIVQLTPDDLCESTAYVVRYTPKSK